MLRRPVFVLVIGAIGLRAHAAAAERSRSIRT